MEGLDHEEDVERRLLEKPEPVEDLCEESEAGERGENSQPFNRNGELPGDFQLGETLLAV